MFFLNSYRAIEPITGRSFTESPGRTVIGVARGETRGERRRHRSHASRTMHGGVGK